MPRMSIGRQFLFLFMIAVPATFAADRVSKGENPQAELNSTVGSFAEQASLEVELEETHLSLEELTPEDRKLLNSHLQSLVHYTSSNQVELSWDGFKEAHESFEGEDPEAVEGTAEKKMPAKIVNFIRDWIQNYNFRRIFYSIHRYYFLDKNIPVSQSLRDFIALFCVSHGTEVAYGVASVVVSFLKGYSTKVILTNATVGLVISMPGWDPLCYILLGSYAASYLPRMGMLLKPYRYTVRFLRIKAEKYGGILYKKLGLKQLIGQFFLNVSALDVLQKTIAELQKQGFRIFLEETSSVDGSFLITLREGGRTQLKLLLRNNRNGTLSMAAIEGQLEDKRLISSVRTVLSRISSNALDAVENSYNRVNQRRSPPFYTQKVEVKKDRLRVEFRAGSIRLNFKLRSATSGCKGLFKIRSKRPIGH